MIQKSEDKKNIVNTYQYRRCQYGNKKWMNQTFSLHTNPILINHKIFNESHLINIQTMDVIIRKEDKSSS